MASSKVKVFSLSRYIEFALHRAEYERDEEGMIVANVAEGLGFISEGETYEEARANLEDAIEGNIILALQLGWDIPAIPGVEIREEDVEINTT